MIEPSFGMLATGGLIAALAAGWAQFKNFMRYASSFLIVRYSLQGVTHRLVLEYLRDNYYLAPSGAKTFDSVNKEYKKRNNWVKVLFKQQLYPLVFIKGLSVVIVNSSTVSAVRALST